MASLTRLRSRIESGSLCIGDLTPRGGLCAPTIRIQEEKGLVEPLRTGGNQRRYLRADIRRLSFVLIAQKLGLSLGEIAEAMSGLPQGRTPNVKDWARISGAIRQRIDAQIARLEKVRADLTGCIGCGCLSLRKCALYNAGDRWSEGGAGPRVLR